jgi:hypothetical protein
MLASCENGSPEQKTMSKDDELDRRRAAAFAWRFTRPDEAVDLPEDGRADTGETAVDQSHETVVGTQAPAPPAASPTRNKRERTDVCAALTHAIEPVRRSAEVELLGTVAPLLLHACAVARELCDLERYPWQSARMHDLAFRCRHVPSAEDWVAEATSTGWPRYSHRKLLELLVETARLHALSSLSLLMLEMSDARCNAVECMQGAVARIAHVVADGPGHIARCIPEDAMSGANARAVATALRRALRTRYFLRRYRALELLDDYVPDMLRAADVVFLLEDAVHHELPDCFASDEIERGTFYFPRMFERIVVRLRPGAALEPLLRIIEGCCAPRRNFRPGLDDEWALGVLAAAFPEAAVPHIDRRLADASRKQREMATAAAGRLPDALARPRLLMAAADGVPEIAERAQAIWRERYTDACSFDPMTDVELALLDGPPSEQMRSHLATLRNSPLEVRTAMIEVFMHAAPDPEALVLLLFAALDERIWEHQTRPGLPRERASFCRALIEGFETRAITGLLALEARYPEGELGWLHALAALVTNGAIPEIAYPGFRAAAARHFGGPDERPKYEAIAILAHVGPPPELTDRLWLMAREPAETSYFSDVIVHALARLPAEDGRLDSMVLAEMEDALAVPDLPRFARAAAVGFARKLADAVALTERALGEFGAARPEDPRVITALAGCVEALATAGHLSDTFLREAFARPGTYLCAIAARHALHRELIEPEAEALVAVLACEDPACAAEAACTLLGRGSIGPKHPGLFAIAARAPLVLRAELLYSMRMRGAPWSFLWPLLESLLVTADPDVTYPLRHIAHEFDKEGLPKKLRPVLPWVADPDLRRDIEDILMSAGYRYWKDQVE